MSAWADPRRNARLTIGVYVLRPDGTRIQLRPPGLVGPASDAEMYAGPTYPPCRCPRHRAETGTAQRQ